MRVRKTEVRERESVFVCERKRGRVCVRERGESV